MGAVHGYQIASSNALCHCQLSPLGLGPGAGEEADGGVEGTEADGGTKEELLNSTDSGKLEGLGAAGSGGVDGSGVEVGGVGVVVVVVEELASLTLRLVMTSRRSWYCPLRLGFSASLYLTCT